MSAKMPQVPVNYPSRPCSVSHLLEPANIPHSATVTNNFNQPISAASSSCRFQNDMRPPPEYSFAISNGYSRHGMSPSTAMSMDDSFASPAAGCHLVPGHGQQTFGYSGVNNQRQQIFDASPTFQTAHPAVQDVWNPTSPFSSPFGSSSNCSEEYFHAAGSSLDVHGGVDPRYMDVPGHVLPNGPADVKSQLRNVLQARATAASSPAASSSAASPPADIPGSSGTFFPAPFPSASSSSTSTVTGTATVAPLTVVTAGSTFPRGPCDPAELFEDRCSRMGRWNLSENEALKRVKRRERNKVAATKCRNKKKERQVNLVKEAEVLESQHKFLKEEQKRLNGEREHLVAMLEDHKNSHACALSSSSSSSHGQNDKFPDPPHDARPNDRSKCPADQVKQEGGNRITMCDAQSDPSTNAGQSSPSSLLDQGMTSNERPFETHNFDWDSFLKEETSAVGNDGYPSFDSSGSSPLAPATEDNLHGLADRDFPQYFPPNHFGHESFDAKSSSSPRREDMKEFDPLTASSSSKNSSISVLDLDNQQPHDRGQKQQETWPSSDSSVDRHRQGSNFPTLSTFETDTQFVDSAEYFSVGSLINGVHQSVWETV